MSSLAVLRTLHVSFRRRLQVKNMEPRYLPRHDLFVVLLSNNGEHGRRTSILANNADNLLDEGRGGHSCVVADSRMVVFGGTFYGGDIFPEMDEHPTWVAATSESVFPMQHLREQGEFTYLNDTWILELDSMTWQEVRCGGEIPSPRYGHCCHLMGSRMFVMSGKGRHGELYRDVHFLDLVDWTWVAVNTTSNGPSPSMSLPLPFRFWQASASVGHKIVIHGGWDGKNRCFGDIWIFDTDRFSWMQPRTGGLPPAPRYGHAMVLLPDGRILVSGGATVDEEYVPRYHQDLRQLDTETMLWSKTKTTGVTPSSRCNHTLTFIEGGQCAVMFGGWGLGGLQSYDTNKRPGTATIAMYSLPPNGPVTIDCMLPGGRGTPEHKYGHTCVSVGGEIFVFGGWNGQQALDQVIVFKLGGTE